MSEITCLFAIQSRVPIALELLSTGVWSGTGVLGPEAFDAKPFLDLMAAPEDKGGYGQPWGIKEL